MVYGAEARRQVNALRQHYEGQGRIEAVMNLDAALAEAEARIERDPEAGLTAPRPYPTVAKPGKAWIKAKRSWTACRTSTPPRIVAVFHDAANIPDRV